jgi:uncharacterized small protein (DUF1192 family)
MKTQIEGYDVEETVSGQSSIANTVTEVTTMNNQVTDSTAFEIATLALMNQRVYKREAEELRTKVSLLEAEIIRLKADNSKLATESYEKAGAIDKLNWLIQKQAVRLAKESGK